MPFKDKKQRNDYMHDYRIKTDQNAYMRDYRKRRKKELDSIVAEWTAIKDRKETPPDVENEQRLLRKIMSLESENISLRSENEILVRQKEHGKTRS